ncbi:MAG: hypothetical protein WCC59_02735 [Terriglobales bacterium]
MLRIEREQKRFTRLDQPSLVESSITERNDLQEFIYNAPAEFFAEVGQELFIIGKEMQPSEIIQDRIDLLALDKDGNAVIVELKRGNDKLQLLQAIAYAGMVAKWQPADFLGRLDGVQQENLSDFLNVQTDEINRNQRILLIAEAYDYEVLVGAEWLHDTYELDILCCRVALAKDAVSGAEYLSCTPVFPAPELDRQAVPRRRAITASDSWPDWDTALSSVTVPAIVAYYRDELSANRESNLNDRSLMYRISGTRRWYLSARSSRCYCWQVGRFEADSEFWSKRLSHGDSVKPVQNGAALRFSIYTSDDLAAFRKAATEELLRAEWYDDVPETVLREDEAEKSISAAGAK